MIYADIEASRSAAKHIVFLDDDKVEYAEIEGTVSGEPITLKITNSQTGELAAKSGIVIKVPVY